MDLPVFIAKLVGVVYIALGLGMLFNSTYYKKAMKEMMSNASFIMLAGMLSLVLGVVIVLAHNVWESSWVVIITILGWLALVKGVLLLVFPKGVSMFDSVFNSKSMITIVGVGALIFGLVLGYFGFIM